ncbi:magnesium/cobalt transporter CorA [Leptospira sp. GIMC2001]|uniref:magnesium/cobalt transporter CorA n=1 Tax=Leptospira sp. GIMC2001 TaxID=1513297 RepID=UPI002349D90A|nr:magnesium/cobalt transporter CorA [Leptospira sp. GIMC2001]WCL50104.1 magnesium/cobalt transporter CorA [Leptospira sp. GIMC2001]
MIRILEYDSQTNSPICTDNYPLNSIPNRNNRIWIDIQSITDEETKYLSDNFLLHPLALEDTRNLNQRPKIEDYDEHSFIVLHTIHFIKPNSLRIREIHFFFNEHYLITIHQHSDPTIESIWQRNAQGEFCVLKNGIDFILHLLCDQIVDSSFPVLDGLSKEIAKLESSLWKENGNNLIENMILIKRSLLRMRRTLSPQRDVFQYLARYDSKYISEKVRFYFRDIFDHLIRIHESIELERDLLGNLLDAYFSLVSQKTNETVKKLTLVSFIFLPLTFVTGFFGMNFEAIPFANPKLFYGSLFVIGALPIGFLIYFWKKKYF